MRSETGNQPEAAALSQMLHRIWERHLPDLRARVDVLEGAAQAVAAGELGEPQREQARHTAHTLAGSLGTFGLGRGTELARQLEGRYGDGDLHPADAPALAQAAAEIRALIETRKRA